MLTITKRTARLNQDYKGKSKEKDGEVTKLLTFGFDEIEIDEKELGAITGEKHAHRSLVDQTKNGARPVFKCFKPFQLNDDFENAAVTVTLRGGAEVKLTPCKVSKVRFTVNEAGVVLMSCKVLAAPPLNAGHVDFVASFGELVDAEIHSGTTKTDQQDLALNRHGTDEQPEAGEKKPRGRRKGNGDGARAH